MMGTRARGGIALTVTVRRPRRFREMHDPPVVSRDAWLAARKDLLAKEKEFTRQRDALNAERRRLPMVEIDKQYAFEGTGGQASLPNLFESRSVYHTYSCYARGTDLAVAGLPATVLPHGTEARIARIPAYHRPARRRCARHVRIRAETGDRHRNTEVITVHDGQLTETQVFFGGKVN